MKKFLKTMTFEFFGGGKHKITAADFFSADNALFLDVRSRDEIASVCFTLHQPTLEVPIDEISDHFTEIPKGPLIGIFCPAGIRASMVYAFLRINGYNNVRIIEGGYSSLTDELKPGKLLKRREKLS